MAHGSKLNSHLGGMEYIHTCISGGWLLNSPKHRSIWYTYIHTYIICDEGHGRCVQSFEEVQLINAVTRPTHIGNSMHKQDPMTKWSWACVWTWSSGQPIRPSTYIHTYFHTYIHTYIHLCCLRSKTIDIAMGLDMGMDMGSDLNSFGVLLGQLRVDSDQFRADLDHFGTYRTGLAYL